MQGTSISLCLFASSARAESHACPRTRCHVFLETAKTFFLCSTASDTAHLLSLFKTLFSKFFSANLLLLVSSNVHLQLLVLFTCERSSPASKLPSETSRMTLLTISLPLLLTVCSAFFAKTKWSASKASTKCGPYFLRLLHSSLEEAFRPLYQVANSSLRSQAESSLCSPLLQPYHTSLYALSNVSGSGHKLLSTVPRMRTIYSKGRMTSIQIGLLENPCRLRSEHGNTFFLHEPQSVSHHENRNGSTKRRDPWPLSANSH